MCEMKTVLVSVCLIVLVTASFCMYWVYPEKNVGQYSEIKNQNPCENEYKKYCLNGGECYYLIEEDIVGCHCTWFYVVHLGETLNKLFFHNIVRVLKFSIQNLTCCKIFVLKSNTF